MYFYFLDIYETSPVSFVQSKKKKKHFTLLMTWGMLGTSYLKKEIKRGRGFHVFVKYF